MLCFIAGAFDVTVLIRGVIEEVADFRSSVGAVAAVSRGFIMVYAVFFWLTMCLVAAGVLLWRGKRLGGWLVGLVLGLEVTVFSLASFAFLTNTAVLPVIVLELYENIVESIIVYTAPIFPLLFVGVGWKDLN
jgi:hypothetical protein